MVWEPLPGLHFFLPLQVLRNTAEEDDLLEKAPFLESSHVLVAIANEAEPTHERK
jgi:hypothetical protein